MSGDLNVILTIFKNWVSDIPKETRDQFESLQKSVDTFFVLFGKILLTNGVKYRFMCDQMYTAIRPFSALYEKKNGKFEFEFSEGKNFVEEIEDNCERAVDYFVNFADLKVVEVKASDYEYISEGINIFSANGKNWKEVINKPVLNVPQMLNETTFYLFTYPQPVIENNVIIKNKNCVNGFSAADGRSVYLNTTRSPDRLVRTVEHELAHNSYHYVPRSKMFSLGDGSSLSPFSARGIDGKGKMILPAGWNKLAGQTISVPPLCEGGVLYEFVFYQKSIKQRSPFCWDKFEISQILTKE